MHDATAEYNSLRDENKELIRLRSQVGYFGFWIIGALGALILLKWNELVTHFAGCPEFGDIKLLLAVPATLLVYLMGVAGAGLALIYTTELKNASDRIGGYLTIFHEMDHPNVNRNANGWFYWSRFEKYSKKETKVRSRSDVRATVQLERILVALPTGVLQLITLLLLGFLCILFYWNIANPTGANDLVPGCVYVYPAYFSAVIFAMLGLYSCIVFWFWIIDQKSITFWSLRWYEVAELAKDKQLVSRFEQDIFGKKREPT